MLSPTDAAAAWRQAGEEAKARAQLVLSDAVRAVARQTLDRMRLPQAVCEDLAEEVTAKVVPRIQCDKVTPGKEAAFTRIAARHAGLSWKRKNDRLAPLPDDDSLISSFASPEDAMAQAQRGRHISSVIMRAPQLYREVLIAVYVEGVMIDVLVGRELQRTGATPGNAREHNKARARIDQRLSRARQWVKDELLKIAEEDDWKLN